MELQPDSSFLGGLREVGFCSSGFHLFVGDGNGVGNVEMVPDPWRRLCSRAVRRVAVYQLPLPRLSYPLLHFILITTLGGAVIPIFTDEDLRLSKVWEDHVISRQMDPVLCDPNLFLLHQWLLKSILSILLLKPNV